MTRARVKSDAATRGMADTADTAARPRQTGRAAAPGPAPSRALASSRGDLINRGLGAAQTFLPRQTCHAVQQRPPPCGRRRAAGRLCAAAAAAASRLTRVPLCAWQEPPPPAACLPPSRPRFVRHAIFRRPPHQGAARPGRAGHGPHPQQRLPRGLARQGAAAQGPRVGAFPPLLPGSRAGRRCAPRGEAGLPRRLGAEAAPPRDGWGCRASLCPALPRLASNTSPWTPGPAALARCGGALPQLASGMAARAPWDGAVPARCGRHCLGPLWPALQTPAFKQRCCGSLAPAPPLGRLAAGSACLPALGRAAAGGKAASA